MTGCRLGGHHKSRADEILLRSTAIAPKISQATNFSAAEASLKKKEFTVKSIPEYHGEAFVS